MKKSVYFVWIIFCSYAVFGQKSVVAEGEALIRVESSQSIDEVTEKSYQMACVNAIENAFGRVIMQGNSTYIQNNQTGDKTESNNIFGFMSDSYVNGEWLETIQKKKEVLNEKDGSRWIKAQVKGKVRELLSPVSSVEAEALSCDSILCKTSTFNNGQSLFFHVQTSKSGYVSIYLDDPESHETSQIFPYQNTKTDDYKQFIFKPDNPYILFSKRFDYFKQKAVIDELFIECQSKSVQYKIFILFSPYPFDKPILSDKSSLMLTNAEKESGISVPKSIESEKFQTWLQKIRNADANIELSFVYIQLKR